MCEGLRIDKKTIHNGASELENAQSAAYCILELSVKVRSIATT